MYLFTVIVTFSILHELKNLKQHTRKHKSDVIHPNNNHCKKMF